MAQATQGFALVTGASSGIGAVYADRLARRGYGLVLVARSAERLLPVANEIRAVVGVPVEILPADLGDRVGVRKVEQFLRRDPRLTMLVNNAGFGATAGVLGTDVERMEQMIDLNVTALTRLTYAAVPGFVARGAGTIVNVSSIVAISPETLNGVYGGTKAFVLAFTQSLQHELSRKGVRVQAVLPGATATDFWETAGLSLEALPEHIVMQPRDLVDAALQGLDNGEIVTIPALPEQAEWSAYDEARRRMAGRLSASKPAARYRAR